MNRVAVLIEDIFALHENSPGHPESPARITAVQAMLAIHPNKDLFDRLPTREATEVELLRVHTPGLISRIAASADRDHTDFDYETAGNRHSYAAARTAAGAVMCGVDAVFENPERPAYAFVRPPGHHAESGQVMGFCLFNSVAVAAEYALQRPDCERVLIFDWDVHHGNGTMHSFYDRSDVFYISTHQFPHYPGTGTVAEVGTGGGTAHTLNIPLPAGCGDDEYRHVINEIITPAIRNYRPDLILVSAGFDAHEQDPLASMFLSSGMYGDMTVAMREVAGEVCDGRLVLALEGGYSLTALAEANDCVLKALCGVWETGGQTGLPADPSVVRITEQLKEKFAFDQP